MMKEKIYKDLNSIYPDQFMNVSGQWGKKNK